MSKARSRAFGILFSAAVVAGIGCSRGASRERAPRPPASAVATPSPLGKGFEPARTFAVIAGVLSFRDPALTRFSPRHRKDQELYDVLAARGVPRGQMTLLLDEQATRSGMRAAIDDVARRAGPGSTLLFYFAGHGLKASDGRTVLSSYDVTSADAASTGFVVADLAPDIAAHFKGTRVLLLADCCYSGALAEAARALAGRGFEAAALTSAEASNLSSGNWTFTQTLLDGLRGDPLCDRDGDGTVTLDELASEVGDAMKYREKQRHGFRSHGLAGSYALASAAQRPAVAKGPFAVGHYVNAPRGGVTRPVRVREAGTERSRVRFYDYSDSQDTEVANRDLTPITFDHHPVGKVLKVIWGGKIYDAKVTRVDGDFHFITYPGWPSHWDEWVMSDRITSETARETASSTRVKVEWRGNWYPAVILQRMGDRCLVHYEGYDASWDEWVDKDRLRE
jgi:hypothetical protein